jgi:hypothetical protein
MARKKTIWNIHIEVLGHEEIYGQIEQFTVTASGLLQFIDSESELRVWVSPGTKWYAVEAERE